MHYVIIIIRVPGIILCRSFDFDSYISDFRDLRRIEIDPQVCYKYFYSYNYNYNEARRIRLEKLLYIYILCIYILYIYIYIYNIQNFLVVREVPTGF
jgi:hypothetical protein